MSHADPDDDRDLVDAMFSVFADGGGDADEGGAAMTVPAPRRPSPLDSAIALPLPAEHESE